MMDNTAVERIASPELATDTLALLEKYRANDDVIFFLGRLVWQGEMVECVPALMAIACDPGRGNYARRVSARSVMTLGTPEQKDKLWETIASQSGLLDRQLLAELLEWAAPSMRSIDLLFRSIERLGPYERYSTSGLDPALANFIDRLPIMADEIDGQPLRQLIEGLNNFLERDPFVERGECHVSKEFAWLMAPAARAVDRLVASRSAQALCPAAIAIVRNMPALRFWQGESDAPRTSLGTNIPRWQELNDLLYWTSISETRAKLAVKGEPLLDDWQIAFLGHFWNFGPEDFERCLGWVHNKEDLDDRLVALSRCVQLYIGAGRPAAWLKLLQAAAHGEKRSEAFLEARLNPKPSPALRKIEAEEREWKRKHNARERAEQQNRADWVRALKENPDRVRYPPGLSTGELSNDQYHLMRIAMGDGSKMDRDEATHWASLIPEFGEPVARAYRDAAVAHWRAYRPMLGSEGANLRSTPYSLLFGMTGLGIEASENSGFAQTLTEEEVRNAFRYLAWQLGGFPSWFEALYRAHAAIGLEAVSRELVWELTHTGTEPLHHILHDILYHAPWLHVEVAPVILAWLREHDVPNPDALRYCIGVLTGGGTKPDLLAELAAMKVRESVGEQKPRWFALWVDTDPASAIPVLESTLESLPANEASDFAQSFAVSLLGERFGAGNRIGAYRNASDLKKLYVLMHRYVRVADDIERVGKGAYSPTLRDDAQDARNTLFELLVTIPGPEAYAAIKALATEHPEPDYRRWMAKRARGRAIMDADEPLWSVEQVRAFGLLDLAPA